MELSGYAVYYVYGGSSSGCYRRKEHCFWKYGNRRAYQCDRVCASDPDVPFHGYLCVCYDHDCRGIYRPYYRGAEGSAGNGR